MGAHWADQPFLSIDCETTGVDPFTDRVVQLAAVRVEADGAYRSWASVVDPGIDIPESAASVHGITTARAQAEGIKPASALGVVSRMLWEHLGDIGPGQPVVMFNARFDLTLLLVEAARHGVDDWPVMVPVLDPMLLDRMVDRYRKGPRKLGDVAAHYGVTLDEDHAHDAAADALAAGQVMRAITVHYPELRDRSLSELWLHQAHGHEQWRQGFVDYRRRTSDPGFDIAPGWPVPLEKDNT